MNRHLHERRKTRPRLCRATILQATVILTLFILSARPACADAESKENSLKIISFNVWFGLDGNGIFRMGEHETGQEKEKRYRGLVAGLREYDPDILFIQEANPLPGYARRLAKDVGMDEIHAVNNGGIRAGPVGVPTNLRMGIAILAKPGLNLKKVGTYRTSGTGIVGDFFCFHLSEVRELLAGVVYPNTRPLYLFCRFRTAMSIAAGSRRFLRQRAPTLQDTSTTRATSRPDSKGSKKTLWGVSLTSKR